MWCAVYTAHDALHMPSSQHSKPGNVAAQLKIVVSVHVSSTSFGFAQQSVTGVFSAHDAEQPSAGANDELTIEPPLVAT
jgi:hypothetical protein